MTLPNEVKAKIVYMYQEGLGASSISKQLGISVDRIYTVLRNEGIAIRRKHFNHARGSANGAWRRGSHLHVGGYVTVQAPEDHKFSGNKVLLHRLLMEQHLNNVSPDHPALEAGYLRSDWHVHHKNEDKQDNRLGNLEVLSRKQHLGHHAQQRAQRTQCKNGHYFTRDNAKLDKRGRRSCKTCHRIQVRNAYRAKVGKEPDFIERLR